MSKTSRADKLHEALEAAEKHGAIRGYYSATGRPGRVWIVEPSSREGTGLGGTLSLTTKQAEAFVSGLGSSAR